jgi:hypothetical protein
MKYNSRDAGDWAADMEHIGVCKSNRWTIDWVGGDAPDDVRKIIRDDSKVSGACNMDGIYSSSGSFITAQRG